MEWSWVWALVGGVVVGAAVGIGWWRDHAARRTLAELERVRLQWASAEARGEQLHREVATLEGERRYWQQEAERWSAEARRWEERAEGAKEALAEAQQRMAALEERLAGEQRRVEQERREQEALWEERLRAVERQAEERVKTLQEQLAQWSAAREALHREFEWLAQRIFEEKSARWVAMSEERLSALLTPMREEMRAFRERVEAVHLAESKDRAVIGEQVRQLAVLNERLAREAKELAEALRGDSRQQGVWGEVVLERLLELAGLREGREFFRQSVLQVVSEEGKRERLRPDVVIQLPGERVMVVDAKTSLRDYVQAVTAGEEEVRQYHRQAHAASLRRHIEALSGRDYLRAFPGKTLDFVVMFVPSDPAYLAGIEADPQLFDFAWQHQVLLTSPATLLFVLRTVAFLWRQEERSHNAEEIARRAGLLYERLVGFVEALDEVGRCLTKGEEAWMRARQRLVTGKGSAIAIAAELQRLGVQVKRELPAAWREGVERVAEEMLNPPLEGG
ncbi:MAG: DNA recombination protein RmuC [Hydrogenophilus sp.]|nr:DNA recombination protein RmuC [Hydrogenophilus sp.]